MRRSDGTYRWSWLASTHSVTDDGQIQRWYRACTDIEDRKRHEESLLQENAALRAELNKSPVTDEIYWFVGVVAQGAG